MRKSPLNRQTVKEQKGKNNNCNSLASDLLVKNGITVIVGLAKNAGKTSLLNWLLYHNKKKSIGVITTGRDGEETDLVYGTPKPKVFIPPNSLYTVRKQILKDHPNGIEIIDKLPYKAGGDDIWLIKNQFPIATEIVGPPSAVEQIKCASLLLAKGADSVIIDGSLDRKAIASSSAVSSLIIVASPAFGKIAEIIEELGKMLDLSSLKQFTPLSKNKLPSFANKVMLLNQKDYTLIREYPFSTILGREKEVHSDTKAILYLPGSLTEKSLQLLPVSANFNLLVKHPLNIQVSSSVLSKIKPYLTTLNRFTISAIAVNSYSVKGNHLDCEKFRMIIRDISKIPVIDITEITNDEVYYAL